jgi:hypothetical protein
VEPLSDDEVARLLRETREEVESLLADPAVSEEAGAAGGPPVRGEGEAMDGRVRAVVAQGRLESVELDPRAKRLSSDELGEQIKTAVNAAFDDLMAKVPAAGPLPDLALIAEQLSEVRTEIMQQINVITQDVVEAMDNLREHTNVSGDPSAHGLEQLLNLTQRNLDDAIKLTGASEPVRGEGEGADGRIRVTVVGGRVESVTLDSRAMRLASPELAGETVSAVNAALDDVRANLADQARGGQEAHADLQKRVREVQDTSLEFMDNYTRSLRDIMLSIEGPDGKR